MYRSCWAQNTFPPFISKCSRIGPRLSAGKKVSALTIRITEISSTVKSGVVTGNEPADSGTSFLPARLPAIARMGMWEIKRPNSVAKPVVVLYQSVFALIPANADPLLPAADVKAYRTCDSPCGPALVMLEVPNLAMAEMAVKPSIGSDNMSTDSLATSTPHTPILLPSQ